MSQKSLPLIWKLLSSSFKVSKKLWCHYHSFFADVSIFSWWLFKFLLKNIFPVIFEPLILWTWLTPHFLVFWEIYILMNHWWPISIPKTSSRVEWSWIMPHGIFFRKSIKNCWKNITWEVIKHIFESSNLIVFQWGVINPNQVVQKLEPILGNENWVCQFSVINKKS